MVKRSRRLCVPSFIAVVFDLFKLLLLCPWLCETVTTYTFRLLDLAGSMIGVGYILRHVRGAYSCDMISFFVILSLWRSRTAWPKIPLYQSSLLLSRDLPHDTTILLPFLFMQPPYFLRIKPVFIHFNDYLVSVGKLWHDVRLSTQLRSDLFTVFFAQVTVNHALFS